MFWYIVLFVCAALIAYSVHATMRTRNLRTLFYMFSTTAISAFMLGALFDADLTNAFGPFLVALLKVFFFVVIILLFLAFAWAASEISSDIRILKESEEDMRKALRRSNQVKKIIDHS